MRKIFRSRLFALMAILGSAGGVAADCASMISGSQADGPITGMLMGTTSVSMSLSGGGWGFGGSYSVSYEIGHYRLNDGSLIKLDCRTYQLTALPV